MLRLLVLLCCSLAINAQIELAHPAPEPYAFAYSSPNEDGTSSSREESGDANGRITGFYVLLGLDGQQRRVDYVADENGFRASVKTNEIGTESQNAADAEYLSSAPTAAELVAQYEASGLGRARIQAARQGAIIGAGLTGPIVSPGLRGVSRVRQVLAAQAGLNGGLVAGPVGPVGPIGPIGPVGPVGPLIGTAEGLRTQTIGLNRGLGGIGLVTPLSGGITRFQSVTAGGGPGLVGVAPIGGLQRINTIRATGGLGLNGIRIGGLLPGAGLQTIQTAGLQGLGLQGLALNRLQGLQGISLGGLRGLNLNGLQGLNLNGLQGGGANLILLPGGLQGAQGLRLVPQGGLIETSETIEELKKKSK